MTDLIEEHTVICACGHFEIFPFNYSQIRAKYKYEIHDEYFIFILCEAIDVVAESVCSRCKEENYVVQ